MKIQRLDPPREFSVGSEGQIRIRHVANVELDANEQVTFTGPGTEYDVVRKEWGYYATPSTNQRLRDHGLRAALVRGGVSGRLYLLLCEAGKEDEFLSYVHNDHMQVVAWLDGDDAASAISAPRGPAPGPRREGPPPCDYCRSAQYRLVKSYDAPPVGETRFAAFANGYQRALWECGGCGHIVNQTPVDPDTLYATEYVDATYGDRMKASFDRVMSLPPERSDNHHRVQRVTKTFTALTGRVSGSVLDVGSGLGVFGARMRERGWAVTANDPDARAARHSREVVGVEAIHGDFMSVAPNKRYDLVTLNKVLEHVRDPIGFLARVRDFLAPNGLAYVEVPDGEAALRESPDREEFFIEHRGAFSAASISHLVRRAGFELVSLHRLREPSSKYTLAAFLTVAKGM